MLAEVAAGAVPGPVASADRISGAFASGAQAKIQCCSMHQDNSLSRLSKPSSSYQEEGDNEFCTEDLYWSIHGSILGRFSSFQEAKEVSSLGGVPSLEETEEATRELHATFVEKNASKFKCINGMMTKSESLQIVRKESGCNVLELTTGANQHDKALQNHRGFLHAEGSKTVASCVELLQHDPVLQAAVVSLARDPAIWDAFLKNNKVQELINKNTDFPQFNAHQEPGSMMLQGRANPFFVALHCLKNLLWNVTDSLVDVVSHAFGLIDKKIFGGRDSDPLDKPFKACMVLTMLVLALVVLRRKPTSSA